MAAAEALNERHVFLFIAIPIHQLIEQRFAIHLARSTTTSTVSSPTTTTSEGRFSSPERIVPRRTQTRSPSIPVFSPPKQPGVLAQRSFLRTTLVTPASRIALASPPLINFRSLPAPATYVRHPHSAGNEAQSNSDDETAGSVRSLVYGRDLSEPPSNSADPTAELTAEIRVLDDLPPLLAQITPEESSLSLDGKHLVTSISRKVS